MYSKNAHHRAITVNSLLQLVNRFYIYDVLTKQLNDNREVGTEMSKVYGHTVDRQTRCTHYHTETDIIAIKFKCCHKYYPCYKCHQECEDHEIAVWKKEEFDELAILCGVCGTEHTIREYLQTNHCVHCHSDFNEGCQNHFHIYFEYDDDCVR